MSQDEKHEYLMHFMRHIVDIRDRKKASEEALVNQQKVTKDNLRRKRYSCPERRGTASQRKGD